MASLQDFQTRAFGMNPLPLQGKIDKKRSRSGLRNPIVPPFSKVVEKASGFLSHRERPKE